MTAPISFALLLDSALRASVLGALVWMILRLAKLRDARTETMIWTAVLVASLAMPLLRLALPGGVAVPLPSRILSFGPAADIARVAVAAHGVLPVPAASLWNRLTAELPMLLWIFYAALVTLNLARLATGLILTLRLYARAQPIAAPWADGRTVRASATITGPISFANCILLPADYREWPQAKLLAVLAHEQSHVRRGDFFIQLFATLYRALFWFSPFAWWLQARLCQLAEAASDEAAVRLLNDRASYAEILVEVSRRARGIPSQIAMAKGPDIHWRIDRILGETQERHLGLGMRILAVGIVLPAAFLAASVHAEVLPMPRAAAIPFFTQIPVNALAIPTTMAQSEGSAPIPLARPNAAPPAHRARSVRVAPGDQADADVSYDPRALLEDPQAVVMPALVPTAQSGKGTRKRFPAAIILNWGGGGD